MHPIENIIQTAVTKINDMVDVNTIVGDAVITPDGSTIIPISKVGFGFVSGGGEYGGNSGSNNGGSDDSGKCECCNQFAGGASAGVSIQPIGFVIVKDDCINMLNLSDKNTCESIIDSIPNMVGAFKDMFSNNSCECDQGKDEQQNG